MTVKQWHQVINHVKRTSLKPIFYSIYEPNLNYGSLVTTQKPDSGNALCIFETKIIEVCFCEREILAKADQMNKKLFNIWFSSA